MSERVASEGPQGTKPLIVAIDFGREVRLNWSREWSSESLGKLTTANRILAGEDVEHSVR